VLNKMKNIKITLALSLFTLMPAIAFSAGDAAEGKNKSMVCQACHGANGIALQPIYPNLAGQHQDYLTKTLEAFRDGSRANAIMSGFASGLSDKAEKLGAIH